MRNLSVMFILLFTLATSPTLAAPGDLTPFQVLKNGVGIEGLEGAQSAVASPDGRHLYVRSLLDNSIVVFAVNPIDGTLTWITTYFDGVDGFDLLNSPQDPAFSSDGAFMYIAASSLTDNGVGVYARNPASGFLTPIESKINDEGDVVDMERPKTTLVAPGDEDVYVLGSNSDSIVRFSRNTTDGTLTFGESYVSGEDGFIELESPNRMTMSADGKHIYVITSTINTSIVVITRDTATGALSYLESFTPADTGLSALALMSDIEISPDGNHVYVTEFLNDTIFVFNRNTTTGALTLASDIADTDGGVDGLDGAGEMALSSDGLTLLVAAFSDNSVAAFTRDAGSGALTFDTILKQGDPGIDGVENATSVVITPDDAFFHVVSQADPEAVSAFSLTEDKTTLALIEVYREGDQTVAGLGESVALVTSNSGEFVYQASPVGSTISIFRRNLENGTLLFEDVVNAVDNPGQGLSAVQRMAISPDGAYLYTAAFGEDSVGVFLLSEVDGSLNFVQTLVDNTGSITGLAQVKDVVLSPDGTSVYAISQLESSIVNFDRSALTGSLTFNEEFTNISEGDRKPTFGIVSPDNEHLYVGGAGSLRIYNRATDTGKLTFFSEIPEGFGGATGLDTVFDLAFSSDGSFLYVVNVSSPGSIAVYERNAISGAVVFVQKIDGDTPTTFPFLDDPISVALSPDDAQVYLSDIGMERIVVFDRDPVAGTLTRRAGIGMSDWPEIVEPAGLAVSTDGAFLYAASTESGARLNVLSIEESEPSEGEGEGEGEEELFLTADQNRDNIIDLSELLRVIQFYNSDGYSCADPPESTEDGYQPGPGDASCAAHTSDYNPEDFAINLSELLRTIQFYNSGGYFYCPDVDPPTEDGFCPGVP